jgi:peptide/nickel transport system permease protein
VPSFIARRCFSALPLLLGVLTLVFILVEAAPGQPFQIEPGAGVSRDAAAHLREIYGTDRPLLQRYLAWLGDFLSFDLGVSFTYREPVARLLREGLANTLWLAGAALVLEFLLGTAAGVAAAAGRRRTLDRLFGFVATVLYSVPSFWLALVLVFLMSVRLGWLPASQMHSVDAPALAAGPRLFDLLRHLVLPCLALALPSAAGTALYVRQEMKDLLGRPFVRIALARGAGRGGIVLRHALKNALRPVVNLLGMALPGLVGGSVVIEVLFAWPGMGRLAYQAVLARDMPLVLGCVWLTSVAVVAGSLVADLLSAALDPRVREPAP